MPVEDAEATLALQNHPGAHVEKDAVTFTVWAPRHESVTLRLDDNEMPMERKPDGYFSLSVAGARAGQRYWFRVPDGLPPDSSRRDRSGRR